MSENPPTSHYPAIRPSHPNSPIRAASLPTFQPTQIFWPRIRGKQNLDTGFADGMEGTFPEDSPSGIKAAFCESHKNKKVPTAHFEKIGVLMLMLFWCLFTGGWCVFRPFWPWELVQAPVIWKGARGVFQKAPNIFMPSQGRNRVPYKHSKLYRLKEIVKAPKKACDHHHPQILNPNILWVPKHSGVLFSIGNLHCSTLVIKNKPMGGLIWKKILCNIHAAFPFGTFRICGLVSAWHIHFCGQKPFVYSSRATLIQSQFCGIPQKSMRITCVIHIFLLYIDYRSKHRCKRAWWGLPCCTSKCVNI